MRLALKLATGAGKTTVMAMLTPGRPSTPSDDRGARASPAALSSLPRGITIKDRLRVLQLNDPASYYASRELDPGDMPDDVNRAKIVITNYSAWTRPRPRVRCSSACWRS